MTRHLGLRTWATGTILLAAVTACGGTADPASSPSSTPPPTARASATSNPNDVAAADASALVRRYVEVLDHVRQHPQAPVSALDSVATSVQLASERNLVDHERAQGQRQTGNVRVVVLAVRSIELDNSDPTTGHVPTALVDVCWDASKTDLVDNSGHSVVSPTRPTRGWVRYTVANYHWTTQQHDGWRISTSTAIKRAPCAAQ